VNWGPLSYIFYTGQGIYENSENQFANISEFYFYWREKCFANYSISVPNFQKDGTSN